MAQRAVRFSKKADAAAEPGPQRTDGEPKSAPARAPAAIPVNIAPLLAPYRRQGRLALRIERMPQRARLSQGRNNGDNSWSLGTDELEDLLYLPPDGALEPPTLSLRVLSVDAGGAVSTVALIDYRVPAEETAAKPQREPAAPSTSPWHAEQINRLESELGRMRSMLNAHESKLTEQAQKPAKPQVDIKAALDQARAEWDGELNRRLADAALSAKEEFERARGAWEGERDAQLADAEALSRHELADAREAWQREMQSALIAAERKWKAAESQHMAEVESRWREEFASRPPVVRADAAEIAARERGEAELQKLRKALSEARTALAERDQALAQARLDARNESDRLKREAAAALAESEKTLKATEGARLQQAEARWREIVNGKIAELTARSEQSEKLLAQAQRDASSKLGQAAADLSTARDRAERELRDLGARFAEMKTALAARDAEIAKLRLAGDDARKAAMAERDAALKFAAASWKEEEAVRLAAAKAEWRNETQRLEAATQADSETSRSQHAAELLRLREELAQSKSAFAKREADFLRIAGDAEQAVVELQRKTDAAVRNAQKNWKAEESLRIASSRAQWHEKMAKEMSEAKRRYQEAEQALAQMREKNMEELQKRSEDYDYDHMRQEITLLQSALDACERELAQLRPNGGEPRDSAQVIPWPRPVPSGSRMTDKEAEEEQHRRGGLLRDAVVMAALVGVVVFSFPYWEPYLPPEWQEQIAAYIGTTQAPAPAKPAPTVAAAAPVAPVERHALVVHGANLRHDPSTSGRVITTVSKGLAVVVLDQHGNWTRVRETTAGGAVTEGWVYNTNLKDESGATAPIAKKAP